jgi:hypothetical protein
MKLTGAKLAEFLGVRADRPVCAETFRVREVGGPRDWGVPCFVVAADTYRANRPNGQGWQAGRICVTRFLVSFDLDRLFPSLTDELFSRHSQNLRLPGGELLRSAKRTNKSGLWWISGPDESPALERPLTVYEAAFLDSWADWGEGFDPCPRDGWRVADGAASVHARRAAPYPLTRSQLEIEEEREREIARALLVARRAEARAARAATLRGLVKRWTTKAKRAETMIAKYSRVLRRLEKGGL